MATGEDMPTFKLVLVGDGGTGRLSLNVDHDNLFAEELQTTHNHMTILHCRIVLGSIINLEYKIPLRKDHLCQETFDWRV